jgi:hypothetical protein
VLHVLHEHVLHQLSDVADALELHLILESLVVRAEESQIAHIIVWCLGWRSERNARKDIRE